MWPFSKREKENVSPAYLYHLTPRYRIKPESKNKYYVERLYGGTRWDTCQEPGTKEEKLHNHTRLYFCTHVFFPTEKEAEKWIKNKMDLFYKMQAEEREREEFQKANPPREVPPYKYLEN